MAVDPAAALQRLIGGNGHFVTSTPFHPNQGPDRRRELTSGQAPFAAILGCIDSRVPPEIVFDAGLGDLLVVRVAGNILDDVVLGSLEFGVTELGIALIAVVGHQRCGAVTAAVQSMDAGFEAAGHLKSVVDALQPVVQSTVPGSNDRIDAVVRSNISLVANWLRGSEPILAPAVRDERLNVVGLYYALDSGRVEIVV